MMDSKQMALKYLMNSCDDMAEACDKNIDSLDSKKTIKDLEKNFGNLFASIKEVVEEFKLNEEKVFGETEKALTRRKKEI